MSMKASNLRYTTGLVLFIASTPALAQSDVSPAILEPGAPEAAASASADSQGVMDIIVTANKREQNLNKVGLALAVVGGDALKAQRITSLADLANAIPGLSFANTATGTPVYTLRGVGFYEQSLGAYPAVSVYVDEISLPFPALTRHAAFDLDRVEILKGPQGTLFGQNATGGAMNFIASKPLNRFSAGADLSYGRFNEVVAEGFVTGPLAPNLNGRLAGRIERADSWQQSITRPGDKSGKIENYMARLQLAYAPTDRVRLLLNVNGSKDKSDTQAPQLISFNIQNPFASPVLLASPFAPETSRAADWTPGLTFGDNRQWQTSLRADIGLTNSITVTSLTSYLDYKHHEGHDIDGAASSNDTTSDRGRVQSFSQELRLANGSDSPLRWVLGGNFEKSKVNQDVDLVFPDSSSGITLGQVFGAAYAINNSSFYSHQKFTTYAVFGNAEYDILPNVTLKGGIRYTDAKDEVRGCHLEKTGATAATEVGSFFYDILLGGSLGAYVPESCFIINDQPSAIGGVQPGSPGEFSDTLHENNISWRTGVDWKVTPDVLVYANVAKGYKAGSFPTVAGSTFRSYLSVKQESVLSYETGFKLTLLDRRLQLNGAAFYYDYRDKQIRSKVNAPPFGILDVLQNIPKSTIKGIELEIQARPVNGLNMNLAATYVDAEIKDFVGINASGLSADFSGADVPFTPKYQISANIDYEQPVTGDLAVFVGTGINYRSSAVSIIGGDQNPPSASVQNKQLFGIDAYTLVDLRAGVKSVDGRWTASVWGKNVFNKYYWNNVVAVFDTVARYAGRPATYGLRLSYRY